MKRLTEKQKAEIRRKYRPYRVSWRKLAAEYGVSQDVIASVLKHKPTK